MWPMCSSSSSSSSRRSRSSADRPGRVSRIASRLSTTDSWRNTEENRERIRDATERSKAFLKDVSERLRSDYDRRPDRDKLIILSSTLAGLALGLLIGVAMPKKSSALVTSLAGSALWLSAGVALLRSGVEEPPEMLNQPPLVWAVVWGVVAVAGMAVQFGLLKRKDGKKAEGEGD